MRVPMAISAETQRADSPSGPPRGGAPGRRAAPSPARGTDPHWPWTLGRAHVRKGRGLGIALALAAAALLLAGAPGCVEEAPVQILNPPRGAMLPAGERVPVTVQTEREGVTLNGEPIGATGSVTVTLDPVDGLGFAVAEAPGDPLLAVRSWHQGTYRDPAAYHPNTLAVALGGSALENDAASVSTLVARMLTDEELASFVPDPLTFQVTLGVPLTVNVSVTSVVSPNAEAWVRMSASEYLPFAVILHDVDVAYTARASSFSSPGRAHFDSIDVSGDLAVTAQGVRLENVEAYASHPVITDSGSLPQQVVQPLADQLEADIPQAIAEAAQAVADEVFSQLVTSLQPRVGLDFPHPVTQEIRLGSIGKVGSTVAISYETRITAATPVVAREDHQVLARQDAAMPQSVSILQVGVGAALLNQYAFAVWDAGNFEGITFTKAELEGMGMEPLQFPYSKLNTVTISLLLPPILEFGLDGARLDIGGIEIALDVEGAPDSTAWTAASVPVNLQHVGDELRILPDYTREVKVRDVGFDKMSSLVDAYKVLRLLRTAVPGVVDAVFGALPAIQTEPMEIEGLNGRPIGVVTPRLLGITQVANLWLIDVYLDFSE